MTTFLKLFAALFQYDYVTVKRQPTQSKQKIVTLGTLLMIPVGLWTFSAFYLAHEFMGVGLVGSLIAGLVLGGIILSIDRSFIASPKIRFKAIFGGLRIVFAIFSTVLGSMAIDVMLFSGDLEEYRKSKGATLEDDFQSEFKETHQGEVLRLAADREKAIADYDRLRDIHIKEMDGEGGTGKKGFGKVAMAKAQEKDKALLRMESLEKQYQEAVMDLDVQALAYAKDKAYKREDAPMSKLKDLHEYVFSSGFTTGVYLFLFVFILLIESFFILYKMAVSDTIYETFLSAEEEYAQQQLEAYRYAKAKSVGEIRILGDDHAKVKKILSSKRKLVS